MAASENISCFFRNLRQLLKDIKKNVRLLKKKICAAAFERHFCVYTIVWLLLKTGNISWFFKECEAASETILRKNVRLPLKRKCAAAS